MVATKFVGTIEGEYVPWIGARLEADAGAGLGDDVPVDGEDPVPPDELQPVPSTVSKATSPMEATEEIRRCRSVIPSSRCVRMPS
jgi:hypothetical protein